MNPRRQSTVHDLAALRLHRDGTRVLNSDGNRSSRRAKYALRDARGNWIAKDAGGLAAVKQRRSQSQPNEDEPTEDALTEEMGGTSKQDKGKGRGEDSGGDEELALMEELGSSSKQDKRKRPTEDNGIDEEPAMITNARARNRKRFDEDMDYLSAGHTASTLAHPSENKDTPPHSSGEPSVALPIPTSDLLKCLHYFASTYYTSMGQLYDATREVRQQRKLRRAQKLKDAQSGATNSSPAPHTESLGDINDHAKEQDAEPSNVGDEQEDEIEEVNSRTGTQKTGRKRKRNKDPRGVEKDMYKVFDGSALMAIGMLFQEHVAQLVHPRIPSGWEEEMAMAERERKAEEKRIRQAKKRRRRRHAVKAEEAEVSDDFEFEDGALSNPGGRGLGATDVEDDSQPDPGAGSDEDGERCFTGSEQ